MKKLGKRLGDVSDLPEELKEELQSIKISELDEQILSIIQEDLGGIANLDEILVGMYRKYGKVQKRQFVAGKAYR